MSDAAWALQTARQVGPIHPPHAHPHPIHKLHTGPLHSHVAGRTDHLPSNVPNGAYVLPADIVSALGEGNTMAGFKIAKRMFEGAGRHFEGMPYAGDNGPYGQGTGLPYGHAKGGHVTKKQNLGIMGGIPVEPATDDIHDVANSNFEFGKYVGNRNVPINKLSGGVRMNDPEQIQRVHDLAAKMKGSNGYISRLIADHNGNILEGQHRLEALKHLKMTHAPVAVVKDLADGYNMQSIRDAIGPMHPDHVHGILRGALESADAAGGPQQAIDRGYYLPAPFSQPFSAALSNMAAQRKSAPMAKGGQITIGRNEKQTTVGPGYEEWQTQPLNGVVNDPQNGVTGPTLDPGPSFQEQLEDNRNRQDIIDQHVGTPLADGGMAANPAFNNWFSGSRVVDENGAPAPQYHSTTGDFSTFRTGPGHGLKLMDGLGAHFGTAEAANQRFRKNYGKAPPPGGNVMPVYLSIKKPLTKKDGSPMNEGELQSHLSKVASQIGIDKNKHRAYSAAYPMRGDIYRQLKDELVRRGYDGIPYVNSHEDRGSTSWIAFHPNQIKSATGNQGTFDPSNPDITKASGGSVDQGVPVAVAGGEHVLAPHEVMFAGMGDLDAGHRALDDFVIRQRAKTVKTLKGLPGPRRD